MKSRSQNAERDDDYVLGGASSPYPGNDFWEMVRRLITPQEYPPATELFRQNSTAHDTYMLDRGLIKLIYLSEAGQELIVGLRLPGDITGAASAILQKPYPVTAVTLTKCVLRRIPAEVFVKLLKTDAVFSWQIHNAQSGEVYDYIANVTGLGCHSARHRPAYLSRLLNQMEQDGILRRESGKVIILSFNKLRRWSKF